MFYDFQRCMSLCTVCNSNLDIVANHRLTERVRLENLKGPGGSGARRWTFLLVRQRDNFRSDVENPEIPVFPAMVPARSEKGPKFRGESVEFLKFIPPLFGQNAISNFDGASKSAAQHGDLKCLDPKISRDARIFSIGGG